MNKLTLKQKLGFGSLATVLLGASLTIAASALLPSSEGAIHACSDISSGQVRVVAAGAQCGTGEGGLQWDRGVIGYAYSPDMDTSDIFMEFQKGNMPMSVTKINSNDGTHVLCVDLPAEVVSAARFATVNGAAGDLLIRDKDVTSNDLDSACGESYEGILASQGLANNATVLVY